MIDPLEAARASGLVTEREPLLVMLSGGADSVCLLDAAVRLGARVEALHVNYGLRGVASDEDERFCRELCERLDVKLHVERASLGAGNLQAQARDARAAAASRLPRRHPRLLPRTRPRLARGRRQRRPAFRAREDPARGDA